MYEKYSKHCGKDVCQSYELATVDNTWVPPALSKKTWWSCLRAGK